jgi:hypothetical protein
MAEKPTAAMVLSIIGGIFVILGGAFIAFVGSLFFSIPGTTGTTGPSTTGIASVVVIVGVIGIIMGLIMIVGGVMMNSNPQSHTMWGVIVLVLSILSWGTAAGGLFIGFLLGLIGGILALTFKPSTMGTPYMGGAMTAMPSQASPPQGSMNMVRCNSCGAMSPMGTTKCPACGASL